MQNHENTGKTMNTHAKTVKNHETQGTTIKNIKHIKICEAKTQKAASIWF